MDYETDTLIRTKCKFSLLKPFFDFGILTRAYIKEINEHILLLEIFFNNYQNLPKFYKKNLLNLKNYFCNFSFEIVFNACLNEKIIEIQKSPRKNFKFLNYLNVLYEQMTELSAIYYFYNLFKNNKFVNNIHLGFYENSDNPDFYLIINGKKKINFEITTSVGHYKKYKQLEKFKRRHPLDEIILISPQKLNSNNHFHFNLDKVLIYLTFKNIHKE